MLKKSKIYFFLFLIILLAVPMLFVQASTLSSTETYKGVVKIYTYYEDDEYYLTPVSSGSGSIINNSGLILTNYHVVTVNDSLDNELPVAFKVCLTIATTEAPECKYSADLVAKEEDRDIALLQIKNISGISDKISFDYIEIGDTDNITEGDSVKALGYPSIGGNTITITSGTVSGTTEKYTSKWIKTDTSFSFGSSGGALVDDFGRLLGITTAAHSDLLGSLGYVIDINSIKGWIEDNENNNRQISSLQARMEDLTTKEQNLKDSNVFINTLPYIKVIKDNGWKFTYDSENSIEITEPEDSDSGSLSINWTKVPLSDLDEYVEAGIEVLVDTGLYSRQGEVEIGGKTGKKVVINMFGEELNQILLSSKNYFIVVTYYYGDEDKSRDDINSILDSIVCSDTGNTFQEKRYYENHDPFFRINLTNDYSLMARNSYIQPVKGISTQNPRFDFSITLSEISNSIQAMDNEEYFNYLKNRGDLADSSINLKPKRYYESSEFNINDELYDEIFYKYKYIDEDENDKIKAFSAGIQLREVDRAILISFEYYGDDEDLWEEYLNNFIEKELAQFSLGRPISTIEDVDNANNIDELETGIEVEDDFKDTCQDCDASSNDIDDEQDQYDVISEEAIESNGEALREKVITTDIGRRLVGKILLQVEQNGEAWYLSPITIKAYFLGRPDDAFSIIRDQGVGITTENLEKIPIGLTNLSGSDGDGDGLSDKFEDAIGTNKSDADSDNDGYGDATEIAGGYDPNMGGGAKMDINTSFVNNQKGKIFLQVENNGEAWYVNPADGKRYFLGRPADAFQVMRELGLGISNEDFTNL